MTMCISLLWQRLSSDEQELVAQAILDSQVAQREAVARDDSTLLGKLEEEGMKVTRPDREAFKQRVMPLRDAGVEEFGPQAKAWFDIIDSAA